MRSANTKRRNDMAGITLFSTSRAQRVAGGLERPRDEEDAQMVPLWARSRFGLTPGSSGAAAPQVPVGQAMGLNRAPSAQRFRQLLQNPARGNANERAAVAGAMRSQAEQARMTQAQRAAALGFQRKLALTGAAAQITGAAGIEKEMVAQGRQNMRTAAEIQAKAEEGTAARDAAAEQARLTREAEATKLQAELDADRAAAEESGEAVMLPNGDVNPAYAEKQRSALYAKLQDAEKNGKIERANAILKKQLELVNTTTRVSQSTDDAGVTVRKTGVVTEPAAGNPLAGAGELPGNPAGNDANANGVDDRDEEWARWAKEHKDSEPIKSKQVMETLKRKYPNVYGG